MMKSFDSLFKKLAKVYEKGMEEMVRFLMLTPSPRPVTAYYAINSTAPETLASTAYMSLPPPAQLAACDVLSSCRGADCALRLLWMISSSSCANWPSGLPH